MRRWMYRWLVGQTLVVAIACGPLALQAQHPNVARGWTPGSFDLGGIDTINSFNGNLTIRIPIGTSYPVGGGMGSYSFSLVYNNSIWDHLSRSATCQGNSSLTDTFAFPSLLSNAGLGWSFSLGRLSLGLPQFTSPPGSLGGYYAPDGSFHPVFAALAQPGGSVTQDGFGFTNNGSYLRFHAASKELEFPDGMLHQFNGEGLPTRIEDRFGNGLTIDYSIANVWKIKEHNRITDPLGANPIRTHSVHFKPVSFPAPPSNAHPNQTLLEQKVVVERIEIAAFDPNDDVAVKAKYNFRYAGEQGDVQIRGDGTIIQSCPPSGLEYSWNTRVVQLAAIELPDGSEYQMTPWSPDAGQFISGRLRRLRLPTGGSMEWDYTHRVMPTGPQDQWVNNHRWIYPAWTSVSAVAKRRLKNENDALVGEWTHSVVAGLAHELVTQVQFPPLDPDLPGHRVVSYFSACAYPAQCVDGPDVSYDVEFGLPFSRRRPSPDPPAGPPGRRYLSQEIFAPGASEPTRRTYVTYAYDFVAGGPNCTSLPICFLERTNKNQRPESQHVEFTDDVLRGAKTWIRTERSDYDGRGHYRSIVTSDNFGYGTSHAETVAWNRKLDGGDEALPPADEPWILNRSSFREQVLGASVVRQETLYDPDTGFLLCERRLRGRRQRSKDDVVVTYDHDRPESPGQLTLERWYGGDGGAVTTDDGCIQPAERLPRYSFRHTYQAGVRKQSVVGGVKVIDLDVNPNTGLPRVSRDSAGVPTTFTYDRMGRLKSSTPRGDATQTVDYIVNGSAALRMVDLKVGASPTLEQRMWALDGLGRVGSDSVGLPAETAGQLRAGYTLSTYNAHGWKTFLSERATNPSLAVGTNLSDYDVFGRAQRIETADGKLTRVDYHGARLVIRTNRVWDGTKEVVASTREEYDGLGRLRQVREPDGTLTRYVYDAAGRLVTVASNGGAGQEPRTFRYDGRGFLVEEVHPENGTTSYEYDARGNVTLKITPTGTLSYHYDDAGRLVRVSSPRSDLRVWTYGADTRLAAAQAYNDREVGGSCTRFEVRQVLGYHPSHGRLQSVGTELWQIPGAQPLERWSQSYEYDPTGKIRQVTYPACGLNCAAGNRSVTTTYDMGRPTSVSGYASRITYHDNGTLHTVAHVNGVDYVQTNDLKGIARPGSIEAVKGNTVLWPREHYKFDGAGNIYRIGTKRYAYDRNSRLVGATISGAAGGYPYREYTYDSFGNITRVARGDADGNVADWVTYSIQTATNRLLGGSYDDSGNLVSYQGSTYRWDPMQTMSSLNTGSETWTHVYDAAGERVWSWRTLPSRIDKFTLRGARNEVLTELTKTGSNYTWQDYAYRERAVLGTTSSDGTASTVRHFDVDHLGSVRLETGPTGTTPIYREYWPYGEEALAPTGAEQMRFTGHERDLGSLANTADDIDYMHARFYRPGIARFLSPDPIHGNPKRPQSFNLYAYTSNNPLTRIDPSGLNWFYVNGRWEWHRGDTYTHVVKGKRQTITSTYTHLLVFQKTGTNQLGAATGTLTLYNQDQVAGTSQAFSGGSGFPVIPNGTFNIRLDIRGRADSSAELKANQQELKQFYGIQEIAPVIVDSFGQAGNHRWEWGSIRAALNERPGETRGEFLGNYLHGKQRPGDYTHGCICDRSEAMLQLLLGLDSDAVPVVPVDVR